MKAKLHLFLKAMPLALAMIVIKWLSFHLLNINDVQINELVEFSDVSIIFTGAFFVMGLLLAGTMSDFKESEKIPGEISCILESIQDWSLMAVFSKKNKPDSGSADVINEAWVKSEIAVINAGVTNWLRSADKKSEVVFPVVRRVNEMAYTLQLHGSDKDCVKAIQDQANLLRRQITRAYTIARTDFVAPAYTLQKSILILILILLLIAKFKTATGAVMVTGIVTFIFLYLFLLIKELDDPFKPDKNTGFQNIETKLLDKFNDRMSKNLNN